MSSVNMSIRTDSELKAQAEEVLSKLGMTMNGAINMFLNQIVRDRAVPLSLSLSSEKSLYADLMRRRIARANGAKYIPNDELIARLQQILDEDNEEVDDVAQI